MTIRSVFAVALSFVVVFGASVVPVHASCAPPMPIPRAIEISPAVFVGTVAELENADRWAIVDVIEVWSGTVDDRVEVRGGPKDPPGPLSSATSVDRSYKLGETYLFVVERGSGSTFRDNICTSTTPYKPELDRFRPASAEDTEGAEGDRSPGPGQPVDLEPVSDGSGPWLVAGVAAGVIVIAGIGGLWLRKKRSG